MRLTINLATRTYLDHRRINKIFGAIIALLLVILIWNVTRFSWNLGELRRLKVDIATMEGRLTSRPANVSEADYNRLLTRIRFYNNIIDVKATNWLGLLEQVEVATPEGIALSSLVPDMKSGELRIEGRARSFANVRSYLESLEDAEGFTHVLLLSHRDIAVGERTRGVLFTISCRTVQK